MIDHGEFWRACERIAREAPLDEHNQNPRERLAARLLRDRKTLEKILSEERDRIERESMPIDRDTR